MFKENAKKVQTIIKTSEEAQSSRLNGFQRLKECCLILGVLTSAFLSIALLTFSPADPSWSQTSWGGDISNAGGQFGAWVADTLFFTFGLLAYLLPVLLVIVTWVFFRTRDEDEHIDLMLWGTRLLGLVILILTSCGLADINFDDIWYFSSGGVLGDVLNSLALPTLNLLGTTLVLLFAWGRVLLYLLASHGSRLSNGSVACFSMFVSGRLIAFAVKKQKLSPLNYNRWHCLTMNLKLSHK